MKKRISILFNENQNKSAIHIVKILGLAGGIDNLQAEKLILDFINKKDIAIDIDEKKIKKVMDTFDELNVKFEILN